MIAPCAATGAALAVVVTLAGCHTSPAGPPGGVDLSGTCQFRACVCVPDDAPFWANADTQPVLWRESGGAYCPPSHSLKLGTAKK